MSYFEHDTTINDPAAVIAKDVADQAEYMGYFEDQERVMKEYIAGSIAPVVQGLIDEWDGKNLRELIAYL